MSIALATCGLGGLGYASIAIRLARRQTGYRPVWEDWIWHAILPWSAYAALAVAALFVIGATALALLLIGIHDAWDSVTHVVLTGDRGDAMRKDWRSRTEKRRTKCRREH